MKLFKLASAIAIFVLFASPDVILMGSLSRLTHSVGANYLQTDHYNDDSHQLAVDQSLALFMPAGYQVAIEVVSSYDEGC